MSRGLHTLLLLPNETVEYAFDNPNRWIDHLPSISAAEIRMLFDYLASEFKIYLTTEMQIVPPIGFNVVATLTRHDATCLRARLEKKCKDHSLQAISQAYGRSSNGDTEWWSYLCRQSRYCPTDECMLVLLMSTTTDIFEDSKANE